MTKQRRCPAYPTWAAVDTILPTGAGFNKWFFGYEALAPRAPHTAKPRRPTRRHGDHCHAGVARVGDAPLSNHDRQKRRRGILGGRIGEHFPLQRLEVSRSVVCLRIAQLDLDGTPAPVVLDDQIDLKALLVAELMDAVGAAAVGG